jgi:hypothetical protein
MGERSSARAGLPSLFDTWSKFDFQFPGVNLASNQVLPVFEICQGGCVCRTQTFSF